MNAVDFINNSEWEKLKAKIDKKEVCEFRKELNVGKNKYSLRLNARWHESWIEENRKDYDLFLSVDYDSSEGVGGFSGSVKIFETYDELKRQINNRLIQFKDYDENEQLSLF